MINKLFTAGSTISQEELTEIQLIPVDKTNPMPDGTVITRVNLLDINRTYIAVHYGGATGKMYKDRGNNPLPATATVARIFVPK